MMAVPEAARMLRRSVRRLQSFCLVLSGLGAGGALAWGMALLLLPDSVGRQILHSAWDPASELLLPVTLAVAGFGYDILGRGAGTRRRIQEPTGPGDRLGGLSGRGARRRGIARRPRRGLGLGRRDPHRGRRLVVGAPSGSARRRVGPAGMSGHYTRSSQISLQ